MDNPETEGGPTTATPGLPQGPSAEPQRPARVEIDDSGASACYANFCRVTGTPEELIIDFGLNMQTHAVPTEPIVVAQRLVANWYTAKRLAYALESTLQRHEATFGAIETDVQKRARRV
jgi:hypothetical protein